MQILVNPSLFLAPFKVHLCVESEGLTYFPLISEKHQEPQGGSIFIKNGTYKIKTLRTFKRRVMKATKFFTCTVLAATMAIAAFTVPTTTTVTNEKPAFIQQLNAMRADTTFVNSTFAKAQCLPDTTLAF